MLEAAIAEAKKLPDEDQDLVAAELMATLADITGSPRYQLSDAQLADLRQRLADPNPRFLEVDEFQARLRRLGS